jgi:DNA-directed RNA polymerase subunit RPC12/RpoP
MSPILPRRRPVPANPAIGGFASGDVSIVEPRVPCPRCGAHVLIEARALDHVSLVCPVCGLKWDEPRTTRRVIRALRATRL